MKKLTRKLFLSVAALAVCAATLVSTTFAWYISNTSAEVSSAKGSVEAGNLQGNLLVAENLEGDIEGDYSTSLTFEECTVKLKPQSQATAANDENSVAIGDWVDKDGKKIETPLFVEYSFWVMSTEADTVTITATITNTSTGFTKQQAYNINGLPTAVGTGTKVAENGTAPAKVGDKFTADALEALRIEITEVGAGEESADKVTVGELTDLDSTYKSPADTVTGGDANLYYYKVLGKVPTNCSNSGSTAASPITWSSIKVTPNEGRLIKMKIWLEGSDSDCWDSCLGQSFNINFSLKTE